MTQKTDNILETNENVEMDKSTITKTLLDGKESTAEFDRKIKLFLYIKHFYHNREPLFFISGRNGSNIIGEELLKLGWKRLLDKDSNNFRLKWVETKNQIKWINLKEGQQLVNHIPNSHLLTNKLGLINTLKHYDRIHDALFQHGSNSTLQIKKCCKEGNPIKKKKIHSGDFLPETYRLDHKTDRITFLDKIKGFPIDYNYYFFRLYRNYLENEIWICKPTCLNQGKGIYLIRSPNRANQVIAEIDNKYLKKPHKIGIGRIMQRYITLPLLLNKRKFDVRAYMIVVSSYPFIVLFHHGYARLCMIEYDADSELIIGHLTNQFIQKKNPNYEKFKDDTVWSMEQLNDYINELSKDDDTICRNWVFNVFANRMKEIMMHCFKACQLKLNARHGMFDIYGFDFMIDDKMHVWLIEVNSNPCFATNCKELKEIIPKFLKETLYIVLECYEKSRRNLSIFPINSLENSEFLYHDKFCPKSYLTVSAYDNMILNSLNYQKMRVIKQLTTCLIGDKLLNNKIQMKYNTNKSVDPSIIGKSMKIKPKSNTGQEKLYKKENLIDCKNNLSTYLNTLYINHPNLNGKDISLKKNKKNGKNINNLSEMSKKINQYHYHKSLNNDTNSMYGNIKSLSSLDKNQKKILNNCSFIEDKIIQKIISSPYISRKNICNMFSGISLLKNSNTNKVENNK
ncbi:Tubulin--tyrosine ligase-like protein 10 [Intoshia linei]|uniref:Tubulin--tyrosine ligase-like protein 10 n=1 Tax=Intoshia linei TaxID=1819745 RepID=A0A177B5S0_9BILA|nr:Tubulin--tyrosine ligase-like protein 10 [Intoshia linei]